MGEIAEQIAAAVGCDPAIRSAVAAAGRFHDLGKADARFQRWLGGDAQRPLAKSEVSRAAWQEGRSSSGWPRGGRHEALSGALVAKWLEGNDPDWDPDLVLHLVLSHHGHARPLIAPVDDEGRRSVDAELDHAVVTADADLSVVDWEQPERFWRLNERYGFWGLALAESIVRQADHVASMEIGADARRRESLEVL